MRERLGQTWLMYLLLAVLCIIAYWPGMRGPFVFDDMHWQEALEFHTSNQGYWQTLLHRPVTPDSVPHGRPLLKFLFVTEAYLFNVTDKTTRVDGVSSTQTLLWAYHGVSLLLHLINVVLVYMLLKRICGEQSKIITWLITAIWAIHPIQTDAVLYVSQQSELLVSCFVLATVVTALSGYRKSAVLLCALGMFCKELMVVTPVLVLFASTLENKTSPWQEVRKHPWFYACLAMTCSIVVSLMMLYPRSASTGNLNGWNNWNYLLTQSQVICYYLLQVVWPTRLVIDPYFERVDAIRTIWPYGLVVVGLLAATVWSLIKRKKPGFWGAWFFVILAPTSSFVPIFTEIAALRRMYLPTLAVLVVITCLLAMLLKRFKAQVACKPVMFVTMLVLASVTWQHSHVYQSQIKLYEDNIAKFPNHKRALRNLAGWYFKQQDYEKALDVYDQMLTQWQDLPNVQYDRITTLLNLGRTQQAIADLQSLIKQHPEHVPFYNKLGMAYAQHQQFDLAMEQFRLAVKMEPYNSLAKQQIAFLYIKQDNIEKAIYWLEQSVYFNMNEKNQVVTSGGSGWNQLGILYAKTKQYEKAQMAFTCATYSGGNDMIDAMNNLQRVNEILGVENPQSYFPKPTQFPLQATTLNQ
jgi:pentatricopeptide repeat protein